MTFQIEDFIWIDVIVDKIIVKHHVYPDEVEEVFFNGSSKIRRATEGRYYLYGRSDDGRHFVRGICLGRSAGRNNFSKRYDRQ